MIEKYKLKNGSVRYRCIAYIGKNENGHSIKVKRSGFKTKKEAQITEARILNDPESYTTQKTTYTYKDVYDIWIDQYENSVRESTLQKTLTLFRLHILPAFGHRDITEIKPIEIEQVMNDWSSRFVHYKKMANYAKKIFEKAFKLDILPFNTFDKVDIPNIRRKPKNDEFYTVDQLKVFLDGAKDRGLKWFALFRLLAYSGARQGEVLALTWKDIDFKAKTMDINKAVSRGLNNQIVVQPPKTDSSIRVIPLDSETLKILKQWKLEQMENLMALGQRKGDDHQLIFPVERTNKHMTTSQIRKHLIAIQEATGLPKYSCHKLRHTHTTLMVQIGTPINRVMERLGHDSAEMTNHYTHVDTSDMAHDIEHFSDMMNR